MAHDARGKVVALTGQRRTVPAALRRALEWRDGGCRFPGCGARRVDAHHVVHWADGGQTRLENLLLLCRRHHRAVHEEGWQVRVEKGGELGFVRPDGRVLPNAPPLPAPSPARVQAVAPDPWEPPGGERLDVALALLTLRNDPG